jgi:NADH dehydrogenase FAD-containing subunit
MCYRSNDKRTSAEQRHAADALRAPLMPSVTLLEDHRQKRLFPTAIGGGATTIELAHQVVARRRQSKSLKFPGLASD